MKKEILERLSEFVETKGGISKVAVTIDRSPQVFYSMFRRGTMPGVDLLSSLMEAYDDFDFNFVVFGHRKDNAYLLSSRRVTPGIPLPTYA